jgi:plasmid stabilization system protein ParE
MRYTVRLRPEVERDLAAAASWYEQQRAGLGHEFLDEFVAMQDRLSDMPLIWPVVHRKTHRALLNRFPFGVYFRIYGADIVIVAVMHGSRNPSRWHDRT